MEDEAYPNDQHISSVSVLRVEELDTDLYRGFHLWKPMSTRVIYGGQLIGQALEAATRTVASKLTVHSLHAYFVRGGDWNLPVTYRVLRIDDGQSFAKRSVLASQQGRPITIVLVSFHKQEPSSFEHQPPMPDVPGPETLEDSAYCLSAKANEIVPARGKPLGGRVLGSAMVAGDFEMSIVARACPMSQEWRKEARAYIWVKICEPIASKETSLHLCLVSYMSDYYMMSTAVLPHPQFEAGIMASLDHSMWFHSPVRADEWLLYELHSPKAANNRVMVTGRFYKQDGTLAVSVVQEGLMRSKL